VVSWKNGKAINVWSGGGGVRCNEMMPRRDGARLDTASFRTPPTIVKGRKVGGI
jgi:hypothetical protein